MIPPAVVTVFMYGCANFRARCSCAWEGHKRRYEARAKLDAYYHAAHTGHLTDFPIVRFRNGRPAKRRCWRMPWWPWAIICGLIFGSAVYFSVPAHADTDLSATQFAYVQTFGPTALCPVINERHTINGVIGATQAVMEDGFTALEAAQIVATAIIHYCPQNIPLLQQLIAAGQHQQRV